MKYGLQVKEGRTLFPLGIRVIEGDVELVIGHAYGTRAGCAENTTGGNTQSSNTGRGGNGPAGFPPPRLEGQRLRQPIPAGREDFIRCPVRWRADGRASPSERKEKCRV